MDRCLRIKYLYHDQDILELEASVWNGRFGGTTQLYVGRGELAEVARSLERFPKARSDEREVTLGSFGAESAGGALQLRFACTDWALHAQLTVLIESAGSAFGFDESARVVSGIEPAAIDEFIPKLRQIETDLTGEACLGFQVL